MAVTITTHWSVLGRDGRHGFAAIAAGMEARAELVVAKVAMDLEAQMKVRAPVRTGTLKNSIQANKIGDMHWRVTVGAEYGIYVEWGTRFMNAQPYVRPAVMVVRPEFRHALRMVIAG